MSLFELNRVSYYYPGVERAALDGVSLLIEEGESALILGPSGGGKSTLARVLAGFIPSFYGGRLEGNIRLRSCPLLECKDLRRSVGMVFQNPERQILAGIVERELVLGMEQLGFPPEKMRRRLLEVSEFLNLAHLWKRHTHSLSGGEKQRVVLASVLAMGPRTLVLDEVLSGLDRLAAEEVLQLLKRLCDDLGYTVIMTEHRTDLCFGFAGRVIWMKEGRIDKDLPAAEFAARIPPQERMYLPQVAQVFLGFPVSAVPLTVREGRGKIREFWTEEYVAEHEPAARSPARDTEISVSHIYFGYQGAAPLFRDLSLNIPCGVTAILGENGAGKSTLLKLMAGFLKPVAGQIRLGEKEIAQLKHGDQIRVVGYLSQAPDDYLIHDTVREELLFTLKNAGMPLPGRTDEVLVEFGIQDFGDRNPRDLSVGERLLVALASVYVADPRILLLDEPTRGLDPEWKLRLGGWIRRFAQGGRRAAVLVTQDLEFAAEYAEFVILLSRGSCLDCGLPRDVLDGNMFFSPQVNRLFQGYAEGIVTIEEAKNVLLRRVAKHGVFSVP